MFDLQTYPAKAQTHFRSGAPSWPLAVQAAAAGGIELDDLADLVFFMHHPERMDGATGKPLRKGERNFTGMAAEWKTWRASAAAVIEMPSPAKPKPPVPPTRHTPEEALTLIREELRRLEEKGELTAKERSVAEAITEDALAGAEFGVSWTSFAASLITLVKGATSTVALAALGSLSMAGVILQFVGFVMALDEAMDVDIRIYRSVAAAYGVTAWVYDEPTPDRNRAVRRRIADRADIDRNWDDAASTARKAMDEKHGTSALRGVLKTLDRRDVARMLVIEIARQLPNSRHNESTALEAIAKRDIDYPN